MSVRAKFRVDYISNPDPNAENKTVSLTAVTGDGDPTSENSSFWINTPSGRISLDISNPAAAVQFEDGKEIYVDFTPVPDQ